MNFQNNFTPSETTQNYGFSSYGVKIGLTGSTQAVLSEMLNIVKSLPLNQQKTNFDDAQIIFSIDLIGGQYLLKKNGKELSFSKDKYHTFKYLQNEIRISVAEFAVSKVFLHAGAAGINNKGVIFPARSFMGKSTITAELVRNGATYYSDDYTVLDEVARLNPFAKELSIRGFDGDKSQIDLPVEHFGGEKGIKPIEVKLIVLTEYEKGAKWAPEVLSPGNAIMELLPHTIPIRFNPKFTLSVLHKLVNGAIIIKSKRGEIEDFIPALLILLKNLNN